MLYTPLLPGAAAGTLEPRHVVVPLREELDPSIHLRLGKITGASPQRNVLHVRSLDGTQEELSYDQLVVSVGSVSRTLPIPGLAEHGMALKSLPEAIARAQPRHPHAGDRRDARGRRRAPRVPDVRLRRRGLRGPRGPRRAAGLRRRRHRPLPALPGHRDALDPRRGQRPRHARDQRQARRLRRARAARPRDRDPHEHDARRGHGEHARRSATARSCRPARSSGRRASSPTR